MIKSNKGKNIFNFDTILLKKTLSKESESKK